jgi:hypothetical protein
MATEVTEAWQKLICEDKNKPFESGSTLYHTSTFDRPIPRIRIWLPEYLNLYYFYHIHVAPLNKVILLNSYTQANCAYWSSYAEYFKEEVGAAVRLWRYYNVKYTLNSWQCDTHVLAYNVCNRV